MAKRNRPVLLNLFLDPTRWKSVLYFFLSLMKHRRWRYKRQSITLKYLISGTHTFAALRKLVPWKGGMPRYIYWSLKWLMLIDCRCFREKLSVEITKMWSRISRKNTPKDRNFLIAFKNTKNVENEFFLYIRKTNEYRTSVVKR